MAPPAGPQRYIRVTRHVSPAHRELCGCLSPAPSLPRFRAGDSALDVDILFAPADEIRPPVVTDGPHRQTSPRGGSRTVSALCPHSATISHGSRTSPFAPVCIYSCGGSARVVTRGIHGWVSGRGTRSPSGSASEPQYTLYMYYKSLRRRRAERRRYLSTHVEARLR